MNIFQEARNWGVHFGTLIMSYIVKLETILDRLLIPHSSLPMCLPIIVMKRPSTNFKNEPSKSVENRILLHFFFLLQYPQEIRLLVRVVHYCSGFWHVQRCRMVIYEYCVRRIHGDSRRFSPIFHLSLRVLALLSASFSHHSLHVTGLGLWIKLTTLRPLRLKKNPEISNDLLLVPVSNLEFSYFFTWL